MQHEWAARAASVFTPNYRPAPLVLERGEGAYVFDEDGARYLDLVAGIAVSALGHNHPVLVAGLAEQAGRILHTSNLYLNRPSIELAERIRELSFGGRVFFCSSGAEANEGAIKLARRYAHHLGHAERHRIVSFTQSFHGRTFGALAATAQPKYHEGFGPMPEGFVHLPMGDEAALSSTVDDRTAAVLIEPVQGEGGVNPAPPGFLRKIRSLCDQSGALMIVDEVQCGVGRTGRMFTYEHDDVRPDVMTLAKGLGGGVPLGAVVARTEVAEALQPGTHGSTYGGNPLACTAGRIVLDEVARPEFLAGVRATAEVLHGEMKRLGSETGLFQQVRGLGLMLGAELTEDAGFDAAEVVAEARNHGVLIHVAGPTTLRLVPPLILTPEQAREGVDKVGAALAVLRSRRT